MARGPNPRGGKRLEGEATTVPPLPGAQAFRPETVAWYETWARSPQAAEFQSTDWMILHRLAWLVDAFYSKPSRQLHAEIRLTEAKLGGAAEDRQRLRWTISPESDDPEPPSSSSRDRPDPRLNPNP